MPVLNWFRGLGLLLVIGLLAVMVFAPIGACGPPVQVFPWPIPTGSSDTDGGTSSGSSCSGQEAADSGTPLAIEADGGGTGLAASTCIVDFNCPPPPSNRQEVFLSGDPSINPDAAGWKCSVPPVVVSGTGQGNTQRPAGFTTGDVAGADQAAFTGDASWTSVNLPYTWNNIDGQDGPYAELPANPYYTGIGWFRKHYTIPSSMTGKRIYIQFDEAEYTTDVYINGTHVGTHQGGYARFRFDITSVVNIGQDNVIAVKVDNSEAVDLNNNWIGGTATNPKPNDNVPPISGDFTLFGGIERDVRILATDNLAITPLDFGSPGVYLSATPPSSPGGPWNFTARVKLLNMGTAAINANVEVDILEEATAATTGADAGAEAAAEAGADAGAEAGAEAGANAGAEAGAAVAGGNGVVLQTFTATAMVQPTADPTSPQEVDLTGQVANPHLWNGLSSPYVYHVNVIVKDGTTVTDAIVQPFGFRSYTFDPNTGFTLNGNPYPLHGVAMHQDHYNLGGQFSFRDPLYLNNIATDYAMLEEINTDFVRCAHYQHSDFTYSMGDYAGIVMWAENAFVNRVSAYCLDATSCQPFIANTTQQYTELIRQNYNHPAIFFWSIGNEVMLKLGPDPAIVMQALVNVGKMEDPSRTVVFASNQGTESYDSNAAWLSEATYFNMYFGWYVGDVAQIGPWADADHKTYPSGIFGMSEYGAGGNPKDHVLPIVETGGDRTLLPQGEEYESFFHEGYWAAIASRPFLTITAVWNMFDFASDYRHEGDEYGLNTKGIVTYDRSVKKDAFYFYKTNWNDGSKGLPKNPVTYITARRYQGTPGQPGNMFHDDPTAPLKVYSNQSDVTATLNGTNLGPPDEQDAATAVPGVYVWSSVPWVSGTNTVTVMASGCTSTDQYACCDEVTWTK
jgi:beta-galactosidase